MEFDIYFANLCIETLSSAVLRTDDDSLLKDIIHFSSLSDDKLDDKFYIYLSSFIEFFVLYICNPSFALNDYYRVIFQRLMVLSTLRFKRGLV
nr:MAG TPA: hypothetical protein [Inoviridae sp.]